MYSAFSSNQKQ